MILIVLSGKHDCLQAQVLLIPTYTYTYSSVLSSLQLLLHDNMLPARHRYVTLGSVHSGPTKLPKTPVS